MGSILYGIASKLKWKLLIATIPVIFILILGLFVAIVAAVSIPHASSSETTASTTSGAMYIPGQVTNLPISKMGLAFIEQWEGAYSNWYDDGYGNMTIGYGHTGPLPAGFTSPLTTGPGGTAEQLLIQDLSSGGYCSSVQKEFHGIVLNQNQMDALISLAYNIGGNAWNSLSLTQAVKTGAPPNVITTDFEKISYAGTTYSPGLYRRRVAEALLYTQGSYTYP
ncbi:lysozyme [Ethanoligenens sp.]|uniref:lysozyme n=1 Tax=Ethanoligenens sp. TaxID=2099655 RepID=UPI0039EC901A